MWLTPEERIKQAVEKLAAAVELRRAAKSEVAVVRQFHLRELVEALISHYLTDQPRSTPRRAPRGEADWSDDVYVPIWDPDVDDDLWDYPEDRYHSYYRDFDDSYYDAARDDKAIEDLVCENSWSFAFAMEDVGPDALPFLVERLQKGWQPDIVRLGIIRAIRTLKPTPDGELLPVLVRAWSDPYVEVREEVRQYLYRYDLGEVVLYLIAALEEGGHWAFDVLDELVFEREDAAKILIQEYKAMPEGALKRDIGRILKPRPTAWGGLWDLEG